MRSLLFGGVALMHILGCQGSLMTKKHNDHATRPETAPSTGDGWHLVFEDNFGAVGDHNKTHLSTNWSVSDSPTNEGPVSQVPTYWTNRTENVYQSNGTLKIRSLIETYKGAHYTSGNVELFQDFTYGRFEAGIKLPAGLGLHPGFWMLAKDTSLPHNMWPMCGEIDIMEEVGFDPLTDYAHIHDGANNWERGNSWAGAKNVSTMFTGFVNYTLLWTPTSISMYGNGVQVLNHENPRTCQHETWPFKVPFVLKIDQVVDDSWGGRHGVNSSIFPNELEVDYVRVYQNSHWKTEEHFTSLTNCQNSPFTLEINADGLDTDLFYDRVVVDGVNAMKINNATQEDLVAMLVKVPSLSNLVSADVTVHTVAPLVDALPNGQVASKKSKLAIQFTLVNKGEATHPRLASNVSQYILNNGGVIKQLPKMLALLLHLLPPHRGATGYDFRSLNRGNSAAITAMGGFPYSLRQIPEDTIYAAQFNHGGQDVGSVDTTSWNLYGGPNGGRALPSFVDLNHMYPGSPDSQMAVGYCEPGEFG